MKAALLLAMNFILILKVAQAQRPVPNNILIEPFAIYNPSVSNLKKYH